MDGYWQQYSFFLYFIFGGGYMDHIKSLGLFDIVYDDRSFHLVSKDLGLEILEGCPLSCGDYGIVLNLARLYTKYLDLFRRFKSGELGCFVLGCIPVYGDLREVESISVGSFIGDISNVQDTSLEFIFGVPVLMSGNPYYILKPLSSLFFYDIKDVGFIDRVRSLSLEYNRLYPLKMEAMSKVSKIDSDMGSFKDKIESLRLSLG